MKFLLTPRIVSRNHQPSSARRSSKLLHNVWLCLRMWSKQRTLLPFLMTLKRLCVSFAQSNSSIHVRPFTNPALYFVIRCIYQSVCTQAGGEYSAVKKEPDAETNTDNGEEEENEEEEDSPYYESD
ncbi:unnamed protein product [Microthlaspi erraticum]|uniref:Uncharacterized protein n=1 Tax=Microthlaspi erraticum TaxID=1685480 RepID=A0A6D2IH50_9BRAS|nr:unnamed protein product [Microthlaspi erraticum]